MSLWEVPCCNLMPICTCSSVNDCLVQVVNQLFNVALYPPCPVYHLPLVVKYSTLLQSRYGVMTLIINHLIFHLEYHAWLQKRYPTRPLFSTFYYLRFINVSSGLVFTSDYSFFFKFFFNFFLSIYTIHIYMLQKDELEGFVIPFNFSASWI